MADSPGTPRRTGRPPVFAEAMDSRAVVKVPRELVVAFNTAAGQLGTNFPTVARAVMQFTVDHADLLARVQVKAAEDEIAVADLLLGLLESYAPPPRK